MIKLHNTCDDFPYATNVLDEKLYNKRKSQNISQTTLANLTGYSRNCIQQMECHEHLPNFFTILHLVDALEFDEETFVRFMLAIWKAFHNDLDLHRRNDEYDDL